MIPLKQLRNFVAWLVVGMVASMIHGYAIQVYANTDIFIDQFSRSSKVVEDVRVTNFWVNDGYMYATYIWFGLLLYFGATLMFTWIRRARLLRSAGIATMLFLSIGLTGCYQPFQPVQLEEIGTNEEGFLIPYVGDVTKQASTNNEEFLRSNMVATKQVQLPQQWVQLGYNRWFMWNGEWRPGAKLIKVDKAPVTREWTADEATGTGKRNEAIWVMTADQVEFSTGWTCTARISSRDDAVKFLHNYPNGSLIQVLDTEVRAKIQALFGMEVTDLPMDELRKNSTPHMRKVIEEVDKFFLVRGITITNLGITGGFVYKNPSIQEKLVEVFNSEQEKNISIAKTQAQTENNKRIQLEAESKAKAILTERKAEADGIKAVADAKAYEIQKAKEDLATYLALKKLELETKKVEKWEGKFPTYFMGGNDPSLLLNIPIDKPVK